MTQSSKGKSEKDNDNLVDNIGKVYNKWIRKGIIGPDGYTPTGSNTSDDIIEEESKHVNIEVDEKEKTETN